MDTFFALVEAGVVLVVVRRVERRMEKRCQGGMTIDKGWFDQKSFDLSSKNVRLLGPQNYR